MAYPLINVVLNGLLSFFFLVLGAKTRKQMVTSTVIKNGFYLDVTRVYLSLAGLLFSATLFSARNMFFGGQDYQLPLSAFRWLMVLAVLHALILVLGWHRLTNFKGIVVDLKYLPGAILAAYRPVFRWLISQRKGTDN